MKRGRGSSKSRSGCRTCKNRKIKCDEKRPACEACARSGLACPGYAQPLKWSRKHEVHVDAPVSSLPSTSTSRPNTISGSSPIRTAPDTASNVPEWTGFDLDEADTELAFQDAALLLSQDLAVAATPSMYSTLYGAGGLAPMSVMNTLSEPHSERLPNIAFFARDREAATTPDITPHAPGPLNDPTIVLESREDQRDVTSAEQQEGTDGPCALLQTFYRLSSPQSFRRPSDDEFVRYYFKHVCRLHSCFDSDLNSFRSLAAKWWSSCNTVSLVLQSMAIAHIANWYPYMAPLGISKRYQAWQSLQKDLHLQRLGRLELNKILLCLFLLGISASWQQVSHIGLPYLYLARNLIQSKLQDQTLQRDTDGLSDFWASSLVYWEMLASLVDPVAITVFDAHGIPELYAQALPNSIRPHPWTGVATEFHFVLAEIFRVSRRRGRCSNSDVGSNKADADQECADDLDHGWLQSLERLLLMIKIPSEPQIEDYRDPSTSKVDLIRTAEAYRGVGMLEAYRLRPDLLYARLNRNDEDSSAAFPFSLPDDHVGYSVEIESYLASIAVHTMNLAAQVPISSVVCRVQPLLIIICANHLRLPGQLHVLGGGEGVQRHEKILHARSFAESRILALSRMLPQAPILRALDIINEVWERLDSDKDGYWMDVMHEKGWQTILG